MLLKRIKIIKVAPNGKGSGLKQKSPLIIMRTPSKKEQLKKTARKLESKKCIRLSGL